MPRDDFGRTTKVKLAERAGHRCSICRAATVGPSADGDEAVSNVGQAAHISAAAPGGPRYKSSLTAEERSEIANAIWLCAVHAKIVDDDSTTYTVEELGRFKREAERQASVALGQPATGAESRTSEGLEVRPVVWEYVPKWRAVVVTVDLVNRSERPEGLELVALELEGSSLEPVVPLAKTVEGRVWLAATVRLEPVSAMRGAWYFGRAVGVGGQEAVVRGKVTARLRIKPIRGLEEIAELEVSEGEWMVSPALVTSDESALRHDQYLLESLDALLPEETLRGILTQVRNDHALFMSQRRALDEYAHRGRLESGRFSDVLLQKKHLLLVERIESLLLLLARHFFVFPPEKQGPDLRVALRPDWTVDRGSPGPGDEARYEALGEELGKTVDGVLEAYADHRGTARVLQVDGPKRGEPMPPAKSVLTPAGFEDCESQEVTSPPLPTEAPLSVPATPLIAVMLTALECEFTAVRACLKNVREETYRGTVFDVGEFAATAPAWQVAVAQTAAGNVPAAACTERAIARYRPQVALFVGVAGGVKDVQLGDVVAATKAYGYERGKDAKRFQARPDVGASAHDLVERAKAEARAVNRDGAASYHAFVAPIAAGEKVVASNQSATRKFIREHYGDAVAVEMEGRGFLEAVYTNRSVSGLVVRGISDMLTGKKKADASGSQEQASKNAADFAFRILMKFRPEVGSDPTSATPPTREDGQAPLLPPLPRTNVAVASDMMLDPVEEMRDPTTDTVIWRKARLSVRLSVGCRDVEWLRNLVVGVVFLSADRLYASESSLPPWVTAAIQVDRAEHHRILTRIFKLGDLDPGTTQSTDWWDATVSVDHAPWRAVVYALAENRAPAWFELQVSKEGTPMVPQPGQGVQIRSHGLMQTGKPTVAVGNVTLV